MRLDLGPATEGVCHLCGVPCGSGALCRTCVLEIEMERAGVPLDEGPFLPDDGDQGEERG